MRCADCKHWELDLDSDLMLSPEEKALRPMVGFCRKAQPYWETTKWDRVAQDTVRVTKPEFVGLKMFVQDGSDFKATLLTTPDFYCAHFEAR